MPKTIIKTEPHPIIWCRDYVYDEFIKEYTIPKETFMCHLVELDGGLNDGIIDSKSYILVDNLYEDCTAPVSEWMEIGEWHSLKKNLTGNKSI